MILERLLVSAAVFMFALWTSLVLARRFALPGEWRLASLLIVQSVAVICTLLVCIVLAATRTFVVWGGKRGAISAWAFYILVCVGGAMGGWLANRGKLRRRGQG